MQYLYKNMKNIRIESNDVWNDIVWQMIHVVLYYETVCSLESLRLHKSFFALRLVFISNSPSPSYSYSSRADTFLKASGTLYRFGSKLGVRGRVSLFNFSILLSILSILLFQSSNVNLWVIRDYFWIYRTLLDLYTGVYSIYFNRSNWLKRKEYERRINK